MTLGRNTIMSLSRRYAASESAKKAVARGSCFVARKSSPSFRMGCGQISQRAALWDGPYEPQTHSPRATSHELRTTKKALENSSAFFTRISGFLSSQGASPQVLSAFAGLTAVFGMGTGGSPQLSPLNYIVQASDKSDVSDSHSFACRLRLLQNWFSAYRILTTA